MRNAGCFASMRLLRSVRTLTGSVVPAAVPSRPNSPGNRNRQGRSYLFWSGRKCNRKYALYLTLSGMLIMRAVDLMVWFLCCTLDNGRISVFPWSGAHHVVSAAEAQATAGTGRKMLVTA